MRSKYGVLEISLYHRKMDADGNIEVFSDYLYYGPELFLDGDNDNTPYTDGSDVKNWLESQGVSANVIW